VFTLPHELAWLSLQNKKVVYNLLFRASAATLLEIAADPQHMGAEIGFLSVLHTWGQNLQIHPHIHCVIPAGGLSPDHQRWIHPRYDFFLPVKVLSKVFRGKFTDGLKAAFYAGQLQFPGRIKMLAQRKAFHAFLRPLFRKRWVVYAKRPFGGPEHVLHYLARYTHRVAISNHRIVNFADGKVTFRWKDYAHKNKTTADDRHRRRVPAAVPAPHSAARLRADPFLRLPRQPPPREPAAGLQTTFGGRRATARCPSAGGQTSGSWLCPCCGGAMALIEKLTPQQMLRRSVGRETFADTSLLPAIGEPSACSGTRT
jgi:hypothetical protein